MINFTKENLGQSVTGIKYKTLDDKGNKVETDEILKFFYFKDGVTETVDNQTVTTKRVYISYNAWIKLKEHKLKVSDLELVSYESEDGSFGLQLQCPSFEQVTIDIDF